MSVAIFVQCDPAQAGFNRQFLIVPSVTPDARPVVWTRITDGTRGRNNKWTSGTTDYALALVGDDEPVNKVVAVGITSTNVRDLVDPDSDGWCATLATRCLMAESKDEDLHGRDIAEVLLSLYARLESSDQSLARLVDGQQAGTISPVLTVAPKVEVIVPRPVMHVPVDDFDEIVADVHITEPSLHTVQTGERMMIVFKKSLAASYVHRTIQGVEDFAMFDKAFETGRTICLQGDTGAAKTTCSLAWAAARGIPVAHVSGSGDIDKGTLLGRVTGEGRELFWQDGLITEAVRHGGLLLLDEIDLIPNDIKTCLYPLMRQRHLTLLDHKNETIHAHPDLFIVATKNIGYAGNRDESHAWTNRFDWHIQWGYDSKVEKKLGVTSAVAALAKQLRDNAQRGELFTPTPTNALITFQDTANALGLDFAIHTFVTRYDAQERSAVQQVLDTHRINIERDLNVTSSAAAEQAAQEDEALSGLSADAFADFTL
jgi:hypothetical protein